jgi:hypothetical protein
MGTPLGAGFWVIIICAVDDTARWAAFHAFYLLEAQVMTASGCHLLKVVGVPHRKAPECSSYITYQ